MPYLHIQLSGARDDALARQTADAAAQLTGLLGDVAEHSYVQVDDVRASAYGYGGQTQEYRQAQ